ncbi:hypothetical protein Vretifemale_5615, partial [Volvox reticuliferus]
TSACKPLTSTSLSSISLPNKFVKATHLLAWRSCLLTSSHNSMSSALMNNDGEAIVHEQVVESVDYEAMPVAKARTLSRRMFFGGFCFLPLLWAVNVWLFWPDFRSPRGDQVIKRHTRWSAIFFIISTSFFLPWLLVYAIAGKRLLSWKVYHALDAAALDLSQYGIGAI